MVRPQGPRTCSLCQQNTYSDPLDPLTNYFLILRLCPKRQKNSLTASLRVLAINMGTPFGRSLTTAELGWAFAPWDFILILSTSVSSGSPRNHEAKKIPADCGKALLLLGRGYARPSLGSFPVNPLPGSQKDKKDPRNRLETWKKPSGFFLETESSAVPSCATSTHREGQH